MKRLINLFFAGLILCSMGFSLQAAQRRRRTQASKAARRRPAAPKRQVVQVPTPKEALPAQVAAEAPIQTQQESPISFLAKIQSKGASTWQDIVAMKRFLNLKRHKECLVNGKGCSRAERAALATIDAIVAILIGTGAYKGREYWKSRWLEPQSPQKEPAKEEEPVKLAEPEKFDVQAFIAAAGRGDQKEVERQLALDGADINAKNSIVNTAFEAAAGWGKSNVVKLLLEKAQEQEVDLEVGPAFMKAVSNNQPEVVKLLLEKAIEQKVDVNAQHNKGKTALHLAAEEPYPQIVKLLLDNGQDLRLDIDAKDQQGNTPAKLAAFWGYDYIVKLLLDAGANPQGLLEAATMGAEGQMKAPGQKLLSDMSSRFSRIKNYVEKAQAAQDE